MGCDIVVALKKATADGNTLIGSNNDYRASQRQVLCRLEGREFAAGEKLQAQFLELPQARKTFTVIASRPDTWWGYSHGLNDRGLAAASTTIKGKMTALGPGLTGGDLVRLALERCISARHAVDLVIHFLERYGQGVAPGSLVNESVGHTFLFADQNEAFAVEAIGNHWVGQEIQEVRAVSNLSVIRQDWDRISSGLATLAISEGWWPADGTKVDFAGITSGSSTGEGSALRRWGRATFLLEQQIGHIDASFIRRILSDHYDDTHFEVSQEGRFAGLVPLCHHGDGISGNATAVSWVAELVNSPDRLPIIYHAFGPPCCTVYFPLTLEGELPAAFTEAVGDGGAVIRKRIHSFGEEVRNNPDVETTARDSIARLQARFDFDAKEFAVEAGMLKAQGESEKLKHFSSAFMVRCLDQFDEVITALGNRQPVAKYHWAQKSREAADYGQDRMRF